MKPTVKEKSHSLWEGSITNLRGDEIEIEAVENGFKVKTTGLVVDKDGDIESRTHRNYVFNDAQEMIAAVSFWTKQQEVKR